MKKILLGLVVILPISIVITLLLMKVPAGSSLENYGQIRCNFTGFPFKASATEDYIMSTDEWSASVAQRNVQKKAEAEASGRVYIEEVGGYYGPPVCYKFFNGLAFLWNFLIALIVITLIYFSIQSLATWSAKKKSQPNM